MFLVYVINSVYQYVRRSGTFLFLPLKFSGVTFVENEVSKFWLVENSIIWSLVWFNSIWSSLLMEPFDDLSDELKRELDRVGYHYGTTVETVLTLTSHMRSHPQYHIRNPRNNSFLVWEPLDVSGNVDFLTVLQSISFSVMIFYLN